MAPTNMPPSGTSSPVDFAAINEAAQPFLAAIVQRLLPDGRREGAEWVALNPRRDDRSLGSFKINLTSGRWCDFATGDRGGDIISLVAFLTNTNQPHAARMILRMLPHGDQG